MTEINQLDLSKCLTEEQIIELANKFNPYPELRDVQKRAIIDIINAYQEHYFNPDAPKVVECPMPTASGKTLVLVLVAKILNYINAANEIIITTPLTALVDQFHNNLKYEDIPCLMGKKNYKCELQSNDIQEFTVEECIFKGNPLKKHIPNIMKTCMNCQYWIDSLEFEEARIKYTTFDRFVVDPNMSCNILFIDESASIERKLRGYYNLKLDKSVNENNIVEWLDKRLVILKEEINENDKQLATVLEKQKENNNNPLAIKIDYRADIKKLQKKAAKLESEQITIYKVKNYIKLQIPYVLCNEILEKFDKKLNTYTKTEIKVFKLITAEYPFEELIAGLDFVVLASGTPTTSLMLDKSKYKVIEVSHPIPKEVRPFVFMPIGKMNYENRNMTVVKIAATLKGIFENESHNVMVHCGSYPILKLIFQELIKIMDRKYIICQTKETRKDSLNTFLISDHRIMLSVEMTDGIDLVGEKFQVNVIVKLPDPLWNDQYTIARNTYDTKKYGFNKWYETTKAIAMMQAYGRTSRTPSDKSTTYALDEGMIRFWKRYNSLKKHKNTLFYSWFDEAVVEI